MFYLLWVTRLEDPRRTHITWDWRLRSSSGEREGERARLRGKDNFTVATSARNRKQDFSLEKYRNRFNLHIMETLRKKLFLPEDLAFYHFNLRLIPKIAAKFAKPARSEVRFLEFKRWPCSMEWWNGGMAEYPTTRNALLYETKVTKNGIARHMKIIYN